MKKIYIHILLILVLLISLFFPFDINSIKEYFSGSTYKGQDTLLDDINRIILDNSSERNRKLTTIINEKIPIFEKKMVDHKKEWLVSPIWTDEDIERHTKKFNFSRNSFIPPNIIENIKMEDIDTQDSIDELELKYNYYFQKLYPNCDFTNIENCEISDFTLGGNPILKYNEDGNIAEEEISREEALNIFENIQNEITNLEKNLFINRWKYS